MKTLRCFILTVGLLSLVSCTSAEKKRTQILSFIAAAQPAQILEGLPHPMWERSLFQREKATAAISSIEGFPFYVGAHSISDPNARQIHLAFTKEDSIREFSGEKKCGGFHPDYCLKFTRDGKEVDALVCFGCSEIIFSGSLGYLRVDANSGLIDRLKALLAEYRTKRPIT